jgi:hypothetical protein
VNVLHHYHNDGPRIDAQPGDTVEKIIDAAVRVHAVIPRVSAGGLLYRVKFPDMQSADYFTGEQLESRISDLNQIQKEVVQ